jgi:hypothetical protein
MTTKPELPLHIDSTMITCFRSCPQKFNLEFVHGYRLPGVSLDLHAGACFSSAVEETRKQIWLNDKNLSEALLMAEARFFQEWGDVEPPEWKRTAKTKDRVWEAVESYFDQYSPKTDHIRPYIATDGKPTLEYTFAIPLEPTSKDNDPWMGSRHNEFPLHPSGAPFLYCGRFDLLGSYNNRPCVLDDKTTGYSIGRNWASQWDLRSQFMGYKWACQQCGIDVQEVAVRGIAIQKEQIVHAEAIKPYPDELLGRWHEQLRRDLWRIRRAWDENYFDFNFGDACTSYGLCSFLNTCASPNPQNWVTEFEVRHWNPLVKNPTAGDENALDTSGRIPSHQAGQHSAFPASMGARS